MVLRVNSIELEASEQYGSRGNIQGGWVGQENLGSNEFAFEAGVFKPVCLHGPRKNILIGSMTGMTCNSSSTTWRVNGGRKYGHHIYGSDKGLIPVN